jgi:hypothetical protein
MKELQLEDWQIAGWRRLGSHCVWVDLHLHWYCYICCGLSRFYSGCVVNVFMLQQTFSPVSSSLLCVHLCFKLHHHIAITKINCLIACKQAVTKDWFTRDLWVHCVGVRDRSSRFDVQLLCSSYVFTITMYKQKQKNRLPLHLQLMQSVIIELWLLHYVMQTPVPRFLDLCLYFVLHHFKEQ